MTLLRRFLGFGSVPLLAFIAPLFLLPVVSRIAGTDGWAAIGSAQAVGTFVAMIASFGWNVNGGAIVALAGSDERRSTVYADSFWSRLAVLLVVGAIGAAVSAALAPTGYALLSAFVTVATGVAALTVTWYAVGAGTPRVVLYYEALPITLSVACALPVLLLTSNLYFYPFFTLLGWVTGLTMLHRNMYGRLLPPLQLARVRGVFRSNLAIALADGAGGSYTSAPIPIAQGTIGVGAAAGLTSADKIYRVALVAVTVLSNALQHWVLERDYSDGRLRRHAVSLSLHLALAVVGGTLLYALGPAVTSIVLGAEVAADHAVFAGYAVTFAIISMTTPIIRNILVPAGANRVVLIAILGAAVVGLPMMFVGSAQGAAGVVLGLALSELVVLAVVGFAATRILLSEYRGQRR